MFLSGRNTDVKRSDRKNISNVIMFKESASIGHILPMPIPIPPKIADAD